ncbi:MAG: 3-isopropylmalate dehydratase small subunit [Chthonomonas sp.]|nr:3-isopropylmalate dehydratase small subunit [Chthonomonas sp.]
MSGFTTLTGKIAVLNQDDVDTDRIIPARFLSMVTKSGYGELAFKDVRGPDFPLDRPEASGAEILVVGTNFGCGSSREHAVWAIQQAGYKAVVANKTAESPGFSDIFRSNAGNCGLALIELGEDDHSKLVAQGSGAIASIDLPKQTVSWPGGNASFEIAPATKSQLIEGLDLIGITLRHKDEIDAFERASKAYVPK